MSNEIYKQRKIDPSASFIVTADHITRYTLKGVFYDRKRLCFPFISNWIFSTMINCKTYFTRIYYDTIPDINRNPFSMVVVQ